MDIPVRKMLVNPNKYGIKCPYELDWETITIHNTYNDASAHNEVQYMINNTNEVSFHDAVDDKEVVTGIPHNRNAWAAGDGAKGTGNRKSLHVEICYSKSGGERYKKAEENTIKYVAKLLKEKGRGIDRVRKHEDWSGKHCPHRILDEGRWAAVLESIQQAMNPPIVPSVVYASHVQDIGWQGARKNGETAGTTGKGLRLEALTIRLDNSTAQLEIQGHIENRGWTSPRTNGEVVGTVGEVLRFEAVKIACNDLNLLYRVHVQDIGWMPWVKNGEVAGTVGRSLRIEAIEIKIA